MFQKRKENVINIDFSVPNLELYLHSAFHLLT